MQFIRLGISCSRQSLRLSRIREVVSLPQRCSCILASQPWFDNRKIPIVQNSLTTPISPWICHRTSQQYFATDSDSKDLSLFQRFKIAYKEHGYTLIGVHVATSIVWYAGFYYAASKGFDVIGLLKDMGASEKIIRPFQSTNLGNFAVAYLMYKLATPARYTVTLGGTNLAIRYFKKTGYIKIVSKEDSLRSLVKEGRAQLKDKRTEYMEDLKKKPK